MKDSSTANIQGAWAGILSQYSRKESCGICLNHEPTEPNGSSGSQPGRPGWTLRVGPALAGVDVSTVGREVPDQFRRQRGAWSGSMPVFSRAVWSWLVSTMDTGILSGAAAASAVAVPMAGIRLWHWSTGSLYRGWCGKGVGGGAYH